MGKREREGENAKGEEGRGEKGNPGGQRVCARSGDASRAVREGKWPAMSSEKVGRLQAGGGGG